MADPLARSFDRAAADYELGRPGYPPDTVDVCARELGLSGMSGVVDVGAGTGKLTRLLVDRFDSVVAVESANALCELLTALVPTADVRAGTAEALPLEDATADAIFVAEAFHWFDGPRALREFARVLRPRGALILVWNRVARPTEPRLPDALRAEMERRFREANHPLDESKAWREAFTDAPFEGLRQAAFEHEQHLDRAALVAWFASVSWVSTLPDDERADLLARIDSWLDAVAYTRFWRAEVHWTRRA